MAILKPDNTTTLCGVTVNEFLLTKHNPNHIDMPSVSMEGKVIGITVHNTDWISVASGTTPAEQYTRATYNGNMKDVRVHYVLGRICPLASPAGTPLTAVETATAEISLLSVLCLLHTTIRTRSRRIIVPGLRQHF